MRTPIIIVVSVVLIVGIALKVRMAGSQTGAPAHHLSRQVLEDKIRGGWAGQMIGVSFGAPTEFKHNGKIIEGEIKWHPDMVSNSIRQDDLYVEMTFTEVMDRLGLEATTEQYGEAFKDSKYRLWHANAGARRALNQGIKAPWSGHPKYNIHANDIDFQIESDFIGMMTPGLPQEANKFADRVGHVMNYGDGVYGGMFFAGMYAAAFFENDPRKVVELGLASLPSESGYAKAIRDVLDWSAQYPDDWKKSWQALKDKWDKDDPCTEGALLDFNIDARLNGAHVALGLLYGKGDFAKTLDVATRAGQDSDCNPSSAAGILGVMQGYNKIPDEWKSGIAAIADKKFDYTDYSFHTIIESTVKRALKVIESVGGKIVGDDITIPYQSPKAAKLEQWNPGIPEKLIESDNAAWSWKGVWSEKRGEDDDDKDKLYGKIANGAGREATLTFSGVAVTLVGPLSQEGGRAEVYLDGKKVGQCDAYVSERTFEDDLWHIYDLKPGAHTLRLVTRSDADARSKGQRIEIRRAIIYRAAH
ncbi:MAG: ADP-ribosylglycohydrolase family protein [Acidobacteria bacterium]|nr:ADP-ribosylglycohydrolase family protein [Acidobacteriota bacterium]